MRLFLLPISTKQSLIYCQRINQQLTKEKTYIDKITIKAATTWLGWEKHEKGWQKKLTIYGNKLFQRLPYEEWGLKSIPPLSARRKSDELDGKEKIRIEFPKSLMKQGAVIEQLEYFGGKEKFGFHSKWMWGSILGMPISAPFALIPIVPNIPFFYLAFRAWSHWRARSGSAHIEFLLENKLIELAPSSILDKVYAVQGIGVSLKELDKEVEGMKTRSSSNAGLDGSGEVPTTMLLSPSDGRLIAECVEVPEMEQEIERAIHQVGGALKAKKESEEEANKGPEAPGKQ
ncbi:hypothetical protein MMC29_008288 [Sticta canariensis]|nr:hypothetical protein [Sticta canariensis]